MWGLQVLTLSKSNKPVEVKLFEEALERHTNSGTRRMTTLLSAVSRLVTPGLVTEYVTNDDRTGLLALFTNAMADTDSTLHAAVTAAVNAAMDAHLAGAKVVADRYPTVRGPKGLVEVAIAADTNPVLHNMRKTIFGQEVVRITGALKADIQQHITQATRAGLHPSVAARKFVDNLGVSPGQGVWVTNYRTALESRSADALQRALRDRRSDGVVARAIANDEPLSKQQINSLVERYKKRVIKYRSNVIARTEMTHMLNRGKQDLLHTYVADNKISAQQVRRFWHYTSDAATREEHVAVPAMNADGVGLNEPFRTPLGPLMYPGDPNGLAANIIQCRCAQYTRIVAMELLQDGPAEQWTTTVNDPRSARAAQETTS
jgi:hypothetical protein